MSSEGTTTTGSIDAKLTVDDSDFKRGMAEAKAEAKEVGALEPTVKVDANVGEALAKLDAVALAERNLDNAYQRSTISQEKLDAVTKKYGDDSAQAATARLAHKRATDAETDAEAKLTAARQKSITEQDRNTESTKRATAAQQGGASALGVLIALAPAALGGAVAISAAAVGLGVAFGAMAVSGVLAIKGIKDEMDSGTLVGAQYAGGLSQLKGNLDTLASTSAVSMLKGFNEVLNALDDKMPYLNTLVGSMSGLLGEMGGTIVNGVLSGMKQMNTLIEMGGVQLSKFVTWLFSFTGTNGFTQFISYAIDNLPATMQLIENLVTTAGHILAAFAPLGPVVLGFLNGLTGALNALPLPVLAGLVAGAAALPAAFGLARTAVSLFGETAAFSALQVEIFGVAVNLAVPVVGIITAALAGIGIAMATSTLNTQQSTQAFNDYTQALKDDNEALGQNVRLQAAKALSDAGAFDAARTLGVSQTVLTDALMGVAGAQDIVNDAVKKGTAYTNDYTQKVHTGGTANLVMSDSQKKTASAIETVTGALGSQRSSIDRSRQVNIDMAAATDRSGESLNSQASALQLNANNFGTTAEAVKGAQEAQDKAKVSTDNQTLAMQLQNDAAGLLKGALDKLNGKAISAAQAQNSFDSSIANMTTRVDKAGNTILVTAANLGDMSSASVALRGQLNTQVTGLQAVVEANGGLDESTGKAREQMETMRQQIIDNAVAHGVDKDAVTAYVDNLLKIPASVPPTKVDVDKAEADLKLQGFQHAIDSLTGKTVMIYTEEHIKSVRDSGDNAGANAETTANQYATGNAYRSGGGTVGYKARGGPVSYLDGGGFPGGPHGTDTVPTWLTPKEFVMQRASAESIGLPALNYMNATGQLPPQQQSQAQLPPIYVQNPFTGEYLLAQVDGRVGAGINAANRDARMRPSR
jgi:hypothetical protein